MQSDPSGQDAFEMVIKPAKQQAQGIQPNPAFLNTPPSTPAQADPTLNTKPSATLAHTGGTMSGSKPVACTRCKAKKIKCDGKTPSCSPCTRAKEECLIADMVTGRVYPRGYIEQLQNRISELQSLIDTKSREAKESASRQGSTSTNTGTPMDTDPSTPSHRSSATSVPPTNVETSFTPPNDGEGDICLARLLVQTLHLRDHGPCISKLSLLVSNDSFHASHSEYPTLGLPSQSTSEILFKRYLDSEHRCFPFWEEADMVLSLRHAYGLDKSKEPSRQDYFRVFMVFAITSMSIAREGDNTAATGFAYYNSALNYATGLPMLGGLDAIRNLLLLCLFALNAKVAQDAWRLSRRAVHICIQEELHHGLAKSAKDSISEEEMKNDRMRKRLFWSAYCLNRLTSNLLYDRPPSIPEAEIDRQLPLESDEQLFSYTPENQQSPPQKSSSRSFLRDLVRLYHLSTVSFTSFNTNPPKGDIVTKFQRYMQDFIDLKSDTFDSIEDDLQSLPIYLTLSFYSHHMLVCQWAISSFLEIRGGIPRDIASLCLGYSLESISLMLGACSETPSYYQSRFSFIILLRALFVVISCLIAPNLTICGVKIARNTAINQAQYDYNLSAALECLIFFGRQFGHGNTYIPALALALRFGLLEHERREALEQEMEFPGSISTSVLAPGEMLFQSSLALGLERVARNTPSEPIEDFSRVYGILEEKYPRLIKLFQSLGIERFRLNLNMTQLDDSAALSASSFKKFGRSAQDLEVLSQQVIWRLKVQFGISDRFSQEALHTRLGTNRPVEPYQQTGPSPWNTLDSQEELLGLMDSGMEIGDGDTVMGIDMNYQPIADFTAGLSGPPKMDVDFSGFETNIITFL